MSLNISNQENAQQAWVVFTGQADLPWLKIFRRGFRHCFVILHDGENWISLDPLSTYTDVIVHKVPSDFDLPLWLKSRGHTVIKTQLQRGPKLAHFTMFTCVEAVKRVLGLHKRFVLTPWQLYRYLRSEKNAPNYTYQQSLQQGDLSWEV